MKPAPPVRRIFLPVSMVNNNTPPSDPTPGRRRIALAALLLAAIALAVYRPWVARPFDTLDFSEFLPLLTGPGSALGRFTGLTHYYLVEHARLNVVSYAGLALKWSLLGASPVLWQWARVLEMGLLVVGVYLLLRRLALRPFPALGGASLFVFSRVVAEAWTRMTMGEPLGLLCALGALLLATTWGERDRALPRAVAAGILMALAVLAKEMLIGLLPLVWLVGTARREDGTLGTPRLDGEAKRRLFWSALPPVAAFLAAGLVAVGGGAGGFTNLYGRDLGALDVFLLLFSRPWLVQGVRPGLQALLLPGNAFFAAFTITGLWLAFRRQDREAHLKWCIGAAAVLCAVFALLYLPWPYSYLYYAIPFHLGPALLFAIALQAVSDEGARGPLAAAAAWLLVACTTIPSTAQSVSFTIALQQVNGDVVHMIGRVPNADRIVVARPNPAPEPWMGTAATLRRYALATGAAHELPGVADLGCPASGALLQRGLGRTLFITYFQNCGPLDAPSSRVVRRYRYLAVDWGGVRIGADSVGADILFTRAALAPAAGAK